MTSPWRNTSRVVLHLSDGALDKVEYVRSALKCTRSKAVDAILRSYTDSEALIEAQDVIGMDVAADMAYRRGHGPT